MSQGADGEGQYAVKATGAICMAVYSPNHAALERQIDSLKAQRVRDWRCEIAIDGGSADDLSLVQACIGDDGRFRVVNYPDRLGFYRNFERAIAQVDYSVDWVALADQDDRWYAHKLERLVPLLDTYVLASGQARVVAESKHGWEDHGSTERKWPGLFADLMDNTVTGSFCVFRSSILRGVLPFPPPTDVAYHDHWIGACAAAIGPVIIVADPLQDYIQHEHNVVGEPRNGHWGSRITQWRARAGGSFSFEYLARERWGWRVTVATELLARIDVTSKARDDLEPFGVGRFSLNLLWRSMRALVRRQAPTGRVAALLVGAVASGRRGRRSRGPEAVGTREGDPQ